MKILRVLFFITSSLMLVFCSKQSDKELFDQAGNLISEQKYKEAVEIYEQLIEQNGNSDLAPKALFESAKIYQGKVLKNISPQESLSKSVQFYKKIYDDYPKSDEAENSLFMAAFILANELNDLTSAKEYYELYLNKFPNGQLARDAEIELKNLGKAPEEILKGKIQEDSLDELSI